MNSWAYRLHGLSANRILNAPISTASLLLSRRAVNRNRGGVGVFVKLLSAYNGEARALPLGGGLDLWISPSLQFSIIPMVDSAQLIALPFVKETFMPSTSTRRRAAREV